MLLDIRSPRTMRRRITTLGKAQEQAIKILAQTPRFAKPRKGQVSARGLVRRHTFESLAGSGMARMRRLDDSRLLLELTAPGERVAAALGFVKPRRSRKARLVRKARGEESRAHH